MKPKTAVARSIRRLLATERPRAKSLIVTVFGDSIAPHGGAVWLGQLVDLLQPFGVGERLVRSSVFRLIRDGWLESHRHGRRSLYTLTPSGKRRFEQAHRKIYLRPEAPWNGEWTMVFAGRAATGLRPRLRRELEWEGFRLLCSGTYMRPAGDLTALGEILDRLGARTEVTVCTAQDIAALRAQPLALNLNLLWDLTAVENGYRRFAARFAIIGELAESPVAWSATEAFMARTLLIHAYRRVLLHDPLLPLELLPAKWAGNDAYSLCREIYRRLYRTAEERTENVLAEDLTSTTKAMDVFFTRFGGLLH